MFNVKLKALRNERGLEAQYVAEKLNVARSTYSGYETGKTKPSFEMLQLISNFFDVSVDYLLGRTEIKKTESVNSAFSINVEELEEEDIEYVKGLVERLKEKHRK